MAQFGGDWRKEQRISLAGRSRTEETRAQVLERIRQEREARRQVKLELRSASTIQESLGQGYILPRQGREGSVGVLVDVCCLASMADIMLGLSLAGLKCRLLSEAGARDNATGQRCDSNGWRDMAELVNVHAGADDCIICIDAAWICTGCRLQSGRCTASLAQVIGPAALLHPAPPAVPVRSNDIFPNAGFLRELCYFVDVTSLADVHLLARACSLILQTAQPADDKASLEGATEAPQLQFCMYAAAGHEQSGAVLQQSGRLLVLCLAALAHHAQVLAPALRQPRKGWAPASAASDPASPILEAVLQLTALDSWEPALGVAASPAVVQLLTACTDHGLFWQLSSIAAAACPEGEAAVTGTQRMGVPSGEALATALTVRFLSQQQSVARLQQRKLAPGMAADRQLPVLLGLPLLLQRMPTLVPVAPRLWRQAVAALSDLSPVLLADWLRTLTARAAFGTHSSAAAAAAALLGNLLEGAMAALKADAPQQLAAARQPALQFAALTSSLLTLLPQQPFFRGASLHGGGGQWADDLDDEAGTAAVAGAAEASRLPWDPEQLPNSGVALQLQLLASGAFLRALVRVILPAASKAAVDSLQPQQGTQLQQVARDVQKLCDLLHRLLDLPGQHQRVLLALAFSAELVQRMWFSYLRQAATAPGDFALVLLHGETTDMATPRWA